MNMYFMKNFLNNINKNKKNASCFLIIALLISLLILTAATSCTSTQGTPTSLPGESTTGPDNSQILNESPLNDGKTINIWDSAQPKDRIFLMESISNFTKINPELKVNARHFRSEEELADVFSAASLSGAGPEIVLAGFDSMKKLAEENILKDLSNEINFNIFLNGLTELSSFDGKKYIIPFSSSDFLVFYYNKDLITEVPANFDDVILRSKELLSSKDPKYGFVINALEPDWVVPFIGGFNEWFYEYGSGDINLNSAAMEKTLNFINNIFNVEKIIPANNGYEELNNLFKSGKAAMFINGVWAVDEYKEAGINFGISKIPRNTITDASPTPMISGLGFMVNSNSSVKSFDTVKKLINFMVSPDIQTSWALNTSSYPAITGLETGSLSGNDLIYNILLQAKICRGKPQEEDMQLIRDVLRMNIESILSGDISPADAKEKMQEDLLKLQSGEIELKDYSATTINAESSSSTKVNNVSSTTNNQ
jgi:arabinogalactan oligomer / maltooligosaccharide transport system substrate-binding protein